MKMKDYLPVGSVVLLKNGKKKLMVIGIKQRVPGEEMKEYDYMGLLYPEGYLTKELVYMFDHEDIAEVIFRGYHDAEREQLLETIEKHLQTRGEEEWL